MHLYNSKLDEQSEICDKLRKRASEIDDNYLNTAKFVACESQKYLWSTSNTLKERVVK
jgi:hypothetical protein